MTTGIICAVIAIAAVVVAIINFFLDGPEWLENVCVVSYLVFGTVGVFLLVLFALRSEPLASFLQEALRSAIAKHSSQRAFIG